MGYRKKTNATALWWIHDLEDKTVFLKFTTTEVFTVGEGAVSGGEEVSEAAWEGSVTQYVGTGTELGDWLRVGVRPPHH